MDDRVCGWIVTGLTGAGKSTVVNSLLARLPADAAVAVCVHHHAKAFMLETTPLEVEQPGVVHFSEVFDFGSGCLCCSPDGDLTR
eukprot:CAMPEP_0204340938 /NCGR_PEP_ID=MMETSP0469-20131031/22967_1 /ASSEMBLY_ACC=CAM_ASM_000384 /TAXON_ID=2969 /ORGANISM="Oxyrrhis marina" /LENGTH=84 /DNA_ID=CAMNT_0051325569 /DNA_START=1 /DNA_END=252 /DNA_ORIENTATION=+